MFLKIKLIAEIKTIEFKSIWKNLLLNFLLIRFPMNTLIIITIIVKNLMSILYSVLNIYKNIAY